VCWSSKADDKRVAVLVDTRGVVHTLAGPFIWNKAPPTLRPPEQATAWKGADVFNTLVVLKRGRQFEIFVNGVPVGQPAIVDGDLHSPNLTLSGGGKPGQPWQAEFQSVKVWYTDSLRPAGK
jgi:hypothetical protein